MFLVEILWKGEALRHFFLYRHHAEEYLMDTAVELLGVARPASGDAAIEALHDSDDVAWASLDEATSSLMPFCPLCGISGGWDGSYCEPCGHQAGDPLEA